MAVPPGGQVQSQIYNQEALAIQNYREFILQYNKITEKCFTKCVSDFNHRKVSEDEGNCVEKCTSKMMKVNHRLMAVFMEIGPPVDKKLGLSGSGMA